jgi:hypothetical protein
VVEAAAVAVVVVVVVVVAVAVQPRLQQPRLIQSGLEPFDYV